MRELIRYVVTTMLSVLCMCMIAYTLIFPSPLACLACVVLAFGCLTEWRLDIWKQ